MQYRNLGRSGLQVSVVGLGCNNFGRRCDLDQSAAVVNRAMELGITLLDTADVYGGDGRSEEYLGKILQGHRHEVVLATKFGMRMGEGPLPKQGGSRKYIMQAVEDSLRRLQTDYIDLYQMHAPDPRTPIEETLRALDDLVTQGKVRYIGNSNYAGWQVAEAHYVGEREHRAPFISAQNEYSLLNRAIEQEVVPAAQKYGLSILPYFPLASGFLTGKYRKGEAKPEGARLSSPAAAPMADRIMTERNWGIVERLDTFCQARGKGLTELAIGWLASKPYVGSVIAGATQPEQVEQNAACADWKLSAEEMAEVDGLAK